MVLINQAQVLEFAPLKEEDPEQLLGEEVAVHLRLKYYLLNLLEDHVKNLSLLNDDVQLPRNRFVRFPLHSTDQSRRALLEVYVVTYDGDGDRD